MSYGIGQLIGYYHNSRLDNSSITFNYTSMMHNPAQSECIATIGAHKYAVDVNFYTGNMEPMCMHERKYTA